MRKLFALIIILLHDSLAQHEIEDYPETENVTQRQELPFPTRCPTLFPSSSPYVEMPIPSLCAAGVAVGTRCPVGCVPGFELIGSCSRVCQESGIWSGQEAQCINRYARCPSLQLDSSRPGQYFPSQYPGQFPGQVPGARPLANLIDENLSTSTASINMLPAADAESNPASSEDLIETTSEAAPDYIIVANSSTNDSPDDEFILMNKSLPQLQPPGQFPGQYPGQIPGQYPANPQMIPAYQVDPLSCLEYGGGVCRFMCPEYTFPVSSLVIVCTQSGQWSQPPPMCQRQTLTPPTQFPPGTYPPTSYPTPYPTPFPSPYPTPFPTPYPSPYPTPYPSPYPTPYPTPFPSPPLPGCYDISAPSYGYLSGTCIRALIGQSCFFSCAVGFTVVGAERLTCTERGWSASPPLCLPVTRPPSPCPTLYPPPYGSIQGSCSDALVGQTCSFTCQPPYQLSGDQILTCNPLGWSSRPPVCSPGLTLPPVSCPPLQQPAFGTNTGSCFNAQTGQSCYFNCNPGYDLRGPSYLICTLNGWMPSSPPTCSPMPTTNPTLPPSSPSPIPSSCLTLAAPLNGQALGVCGNAQLGQTCYFSCNQGFKISGISLLSCNGPAGWSGSPPLCLPDSLPPSTFPTPSLPTFPTLPTAPPPPGTQSPCFDLNPPTFGFVRGTCVSANSGDSCYYSCFVGYGIVGISQLTCGSTGWSTQAPVCLPITCPNITQVTNGVLTGTCSPGTSSRSCTLTCNQGFKLAAMQQQDSQAFTIYCRETRQWSEPFPACIPITCPALPDTIPNGMTVQGSFCSPGEALKLCQYRCDPGFYIAGSASIFCQLSGRWSSDLPVCNRITCRSILPTSITLTKGQCDPGYASATCEVSCAPRYEPRQPTIITCLTNGSWDITAPDCTRIKCSTLPPVANSQKVNSPVPPLLSSCNPPLAGDRCVIQCNARHWTETDHTQGYALQCSVDGVLSGTIQDCIPITCPPLLVPQNGVLAGSCYDATVDQKCTFSCNRNFFGSGEGICGGNGQWSPPFDEPVVCERKTCPDWNITAVIQNGYMEGLGCANVSRPGIAGEYCIYRCQDGYALRGNPYIRCLDDRINDATARFDPAKTPECVAILCPRPIPAAMSGVLFIDCILYRAGTTCNITCENSEFAPSVSKITCLSSGTWDTDPSTVSCASSKPSCSDPLPTNPDGQWVGDCSPGIEGKECRFECRYGYTVGNNGVRKCIGGSWDSLLVPQCVPVTCPGLTAPSNAVLEGTCAPGLPSMSCVVACSPGYVLDPPNAIKVLLCNPDGMWASEMPACVGISCPSLSPPPGGYMMGLCTPGRARESCSFQCPSGYFIQGMPNIVCRVDGTWSGPVPRCVSPSGQLPPGTIDPGPAPGQPSPGPSPGPNPGQPGPSPIPRPPTSRPVTPSTPGCRPRRICCQFLTLHPIFVIGGCRSGNQNRLPEAGTSCQIRCRSGHLLEMKTKVPRRMASQSSSSSSSETFKQELFIHKKVISVTCMRSQRWSGADFSSMRCVSPSSLTNHNDKNSRPVAGRPWINIVTNETRVIVTDH